MLNREVFDGGAEDGAAVVCATSDVQSIARKLEMQRLMCASIGLVWHSAATAEGNMTLSRLAEIAAPRARVTTGLA